MSDYEPDTALPTVEGEGTSDESNDDQRKKLFEHQFQEGSSPRTDPSLQALHYGTASEDISYAASEQTFEPAAEQTAATTEDRAQTQEHTTTGAEDISFLGLRNSAKTPQKTEDAPEQETQNRTEAVFKQAETGVENRVTAADGQTTQFGPTAEAQQEAPPQPEVQSAESEPEPQVSQDKPEYLPPTDLELSGTSVAEGDPGAIIGRLAVLDGDQGEGHSFEVSDARFEVVDGILKLKDGVALDFEESHSVDIEVLVIDDNGATYTETFQIGVEDRNDTPENLTISNPTLAENQEGAVLADVSTFDADGDTLTYAVSDDRFEVFEGKLKLKEGIALDHEAENGAVSLTISVTDTHGASVSEDVTLQIQDLNDAPEGLNLTGGLLSENHEGANVGDLAAQDQDGDALTYTVSDTRFEVVGGTLKLKDGTALDHEDSAALTIEVTATDPGGLATTQTFALTVQDINEAPEGLALSGLTLNENDAGATIGTLTATDTDGDALTYTVSDTRFEVVGGTLKLKDGTALDHEDSAALTIEVTATDPGGLATTQTFALTVQDINEAPEGLALSGLTLNENDAGATIGTLTATDTDGDALTYTVSDTRFEVVGGTLKLKDGVSLDREEAAAISVEITATDAEGASQVETFEISVTDINEAPTGLSLTSMTINENADGVVVGSVNVEDADSSAFTFALSDDRFEVVDGNVQLKDGFSLDHEAAPEVTFDVTATDEAGGSVTESMTVAVSDVNEGPTDIVLSATSPTSEGLALWLDARDIDGDGAVDQGGQSTNAWVDKSGHGNHGRLVGDAPSVSDAGIQIGETGSRYTIQSHDTLNKGTFAEKTFAISFETGDDVSGFQMIYEQGGSTRGYSLSIAEHPQTGEPTLYGLAFNVAEWDKGHQINAVELGTVQPNQSYSIALVHDASAPDMEDRVLDGYLNGEQVDRVTNVDVQYNHPDAAGIGNINNGSRHPVTGKGISSKNTDAAFDGTITEVASWNRALDVEEVAMLDAQFTANRSGEGNLQVTEGADDGTLLVTLSARDPDADETFTYDLVDATGAPVDDAAFEIVGDQIRVKSGAFIDYEAGETATLNVRVTDSGGASRVEEVDVAILDVNEDPSNISLDAPALSDDAAGGTFVGSISADDQDTDDRLTFMLVDNEDRPIDHDVFEIQGGDLYLKEGVDIDYETASSIDIRVAAMDSAGNVASKTVRIDVFDADAEPAAAAPPAQDDAANEFAVADQAAPPDGSWVDAADSPPKSSETADASAMDEEVVATEAGTESEELFVTYERSDW